VLSGEQLGGREAPIATGDRHDVPASGPEVFGAGTWVGKDPDHVAPLEEAGRESRCLVGGDVECPGHSAEHLSPREARSEQGEGHRPPAGKTGIGLLLLVDRPLVERYTRLPFEDPEHFLDICRARRCRGCDQPERVGQVVDRCRSPAALPVGELDGGELLPPAFLEGVELGATFWLALPGVERGGLGRLLGRGPPDLHSFLDVGPALRESLEDRLWDVSQFAQPVASKVPGEAERCQLGPQRGPVEGACGLLPQVELASVGGRPPAVGSVHQIGHDDVGVELGVAGPTGAVPKGRADEAVGFDQLGPASAPTGEAGLGREVIDH
jgi:hypothetical protein